jgi:prepilin-type N-terminal cleavage/methylation domain-containing protein
MQKKRSGLTLVEVIAAMLLFSIGALGLAAGSAVVARQMKSNHLRMQSASIARERDERFHARPCAALSSGGESRAGVRSTWTITTGAAASLDQQLERVSMNRRHSDRYLSAVPCD